MISEFPFAALPKISRQQEMLRRQIRHWLAGREVIEAGRRFYQRWGIGDEKHAAGFKLELIDVQKVKADEACLLFRRENVPFWLNGPGQGWASVVFDQHAARQIVTLALHSGPIVSTQSITTAGRGIVSYVLATLLQELNEVIGGYSLLPPNSVNETAQILPHFGEDVIVIETTLPTELNQGSLWIILPGLIDAERFISLAEWPTRRTRRLCGWNISLPIEKTIFLLPDNEVKTLRCGDVIFSPSCPLANFFVEAALQCQDGFFPVRVEREKVIIEDKFQRGRWAMSNLELERTAIAKELQVELVLELGRVQLTGAEVLGLTTGDVLALNRPLNAVVDLRVGNRLVARGELVNVDEERGVRIVEVFE